MRATTIKIENPLLNQIDSIKPKSLSISAFIRQILEKEIRQKQLSQAATDYMIWLGKNPDEETLANEWESADLTQPVAPGKTRKNK